MSLESTPRMATTFGRGVTRLLLVILALALALAVTAGLMPPASATTGPQTPQTTQSQTLASQEEVDAAFERLRADGMIFDQDEGTRTGVEAATATTFGRSLFNGVAFAGGQVILSEVLSLMGYDPDSQLTAALAEISSSIKALNDEVRRISEQVERLLEGQDRSNFYNSYTQAGLAASNLDTAMRSVSGWVERDLDPSESNLSDMQTIIKTSIGQLDFALNNPTTGTVPLMMKAADPAGVSDLENYWLQIDTLRDDYRAVLAQGLATLSMMERWDQTGTIRADLETFTPRATATVAGMYEYGVGLEASRLHARNSQMLLLPLGDQAVSGEFDARNVGTRGQVEPVLQAMAANYRPSDHGGQTLEALMKAHRIPTEINYLDTYGAELRNNRWTSVNVVGRINGNTYEATERHFGNTYSPLDRNGRNNALAQAWMYQNTEGPGATRVSVTVNVGGRATDFTPDVLEQAAFGLDCEGCPILPSSP